MMFVRRHVSTSSMAPFVSRSHGSNWFRREFPTHTVEHQVEAVEIWIAFITPKLLSARLGTRKDNLGIVGY